MTTVTLPYFFDDALLISTQNREALPFAIKRVFLIKDIEKNTVRGKHAHKHTRQALFCLQGSVKIRLDDGKRKKTYVLSKPHKGIFIDRLVWSEMFDFSPDAILVVFASDYFKPNEYIRDYKTFRTKAR
jgi:dTDP-4-dehydrorhamnose 3,5-epimerase-like enzyme